MSDGSSRPPSNPPDRKKVKGMDRRRFLELTGVGTGALMAGASSLAADTPESSRKPRRAPWVRTGSGPADVIVVGAGAFGGWAAMEMQMRGARVRVVDAYGPANSRATSSGETRGVRSSYGNEVHGLLWGRWARESMGRWKEFDAEYGDGELYFETGDIILRDEDEPFLRNTRANWDELGVEYEFIDADEVARRWTIFDLDGITVGLYEPDAGVVRARRAMQVVADVFEDNGGEIVIGRVQNPGEFEGDLAGITLESGETMEAETYVFALGPWFPKVLPELMSRRLRISLGNTLYFGTPVGDDRYTFPNCPSWNFRGVTGWPALPVDNRGFRVRTGGGPGDDPDEASRVLTWQGLHRGLSFVQQRFPEIAAEPILETRSCFYETSVDSNFFIDLYPGRSNMWLCGGGSAEAFKQGPTLGDYIARRVLGMATDAEEDEAFRLNDEEFEERELRRE